MSLRSKLGRRKERGSDLSSRAPDRAALLEGLRREMVRIAARHAPRTEPQETPPPRGDDEEELPGAEVRTSVGPVLVRRWTYAADHCHGREPVAGFLAPGPGLGALGRVPAIEGLPRTSALFMDTETTGLSGGAGTLPFLVGLGRVAPSGSFELVQILAREPCEEPALLEVLVAELEGAAYWVTFNGRAFDLPLLNTRFVINRMKNPGAAWPHLDLLHAARRVFGRRLADRSLVSLEDAVLGFRREGDIPGGLIPAVYADFLRGGPAAPMIAVLEHNANDLVALAALGGVLERMYGDPAAVAHADDHVGLARSAIDAGERAIAEEHLGRAGDAAGEDARRVALHLLARAAARRGESDPARDLWLELVADDPADGFAHLALAKHFEHREHDFARAAEHARMAAEAEGDEAAERRRTRLSRKKEKNDG
ncbi:MAG TPA: ribonuclease H-like domain-containing protein [Polyangia bacterium]|nr:ribonuclease H-like domain-containing protein [Polyangia bacterium]